jgi:hypothetical protein
VCVCVCVCVCEREREREREYVCNLPLRPVRADLSTYCFGPFPLAAHAYETRTYHMSMPCLTQMGGKVNQHMDTSAEVVPVLWCEGVVPAAAAKLRLSALLADPEVRLPDLAAELARISGADLSDEAAEQSMKVRCLPQLSQSPGKRFMLVFNLLICHLLSCRLLLCPSVTCFPTDQEQVG